MLLEGMTNGFKWDVLITIGTLLGIFVTIIRPLLILNANIVKLDNTISAITQNIENFKEENADAHKRMWSKLDDHDKKITDQDVKITKIETKMDVCYKK